MMGQFVEWKGRRYPVKGYATAGKQVFILWLQGSDGEFRLTGKQLREVSYV